MTTDKQSAPKAQIPEPPIQPLGDPELEDIESAEIEDRSDEPELSFEGLAQRGRRLAPDRVRVVVESLLLVSDKPLSVDQLHQATGCDRRVLREALESLAEVHREGISGIVLVEVAGGWQFRTDPSASEYVRRLLRVRPQRLTRAAVETLAVVAYRQPVTRPEIEDIRGVDCAAVIKALLERRLVKILGRKEEPGRPILYGTTREFLEFFALRDLASLPTLREFQELSKEHQEIVEKEAPAAPHDAHDIVSELADPGFRERLDQTGKESEAALAELEKAIAGADERAKAAAHLLNPQKAVPEQTHEP